MARRMILTTAAVIAALHAGLATAQESFYSRYDYERCEPASSSEPDVIEVRRCPGRANFDVHWIAEPDSTSVNFGAASSEETLDVGGGLRGRYNHRMANRGGRRCPCRRDGAISDRRRHRQLSRTVLVAYRLEPSHTSCVMALVRGAMDNERVREIVDRSVSGFICGTSARIDD